MVGAAGLAADGGQAHAPWPGANAGESKRSQPGAPAALARELATRRSGNGGGGEGGGGGAPLGISHSSLTSAMVAVLPWSQGGAGVQTQGGRSAQIEAMGSQGEDLLRGGGGDRRELRRPPKGNGIIKMSSIQTSKTLAALTRSKAAVGKRQDGSAYTRTEATAKKQVSFHPQESEVTVGCSFALTSFSCSCTRTLPNEHQHPSQHRAETEGEGAKEGGWEGGRERERDRARERERESLLGTILAERGLLFSLCARAHASFFRVSTPVTLQYGRCAL